MGRLDRLRGADRGKQAAGVAEGGQVPAKEKIPTTPLMLAVAISDRTNSSLAGILKTIEKIGGPSPTQEGTADAFRELLCAHYSLCCGHLGPGRRRPANGYRGGRDILLLYGGYVQ